MAVIEAKKIAFITIMVALGNILSGISIYLAPIYPGVNFDFSHITTFIAAIYGGPIYGFIVGLFGGVWAGFYFGFIGGTLSWLSLVGLPAGKSLTGLTAGLFFKVFKIRERKNAPAITVPAVLLSFVPETLFTVFYFLALAPYFFTFGFGVFILGLILPKAWIEIAIMSVIMAIFVANRGFSTFVANFLAVKKSNEVLKARLDT